MERVLGKEVRELVLVLVYVIKHSFDCVFELVLVLVYVIKNSFDCVWGKAVS